jgi:predicted kinase
MTLEIVLMMGLQASGKTTVVKARYASTHTVVSKDLLRRGRDVEARQRRLIEDSLAQGTSVVVDNTHASASSRATVMQMGRAAGARVVGIYMASSIEKCRERNSTRRGAACVPEVALRSTLKRLERPTLAEGFDELWYGRLHEDSDGFDLSAWDEKQEERR